MTFRPRWVLAAAAGLWLTQAVPGQEPGRLGLAKDRAPTPPATANQRVADTIAEHLRQSGQLRGYTVRVDFRDGVAELSGSVADQAQHDEVLRIVQGVPAVERVHDGLALAGAIRQVQGLDAPPPPPVPAGRLGGNDRPAAAGPVAEPVPLVAAPPPSYYDLNPPRMPPYAWPTYAPYNNFSRVGYPQLYPYNSWPFIGPCYPFPKIPLGWRKVSLEWQDGYWWYATHGNSHDWWRLRYW